MKPSNQKSILITQCLQNDFVKPISNLAPLPNALHVGHAEARRLVGEDINEGPVNTIIEWAYQAEDLEIIHIRDWHDSSEQGQQDHLQQFGLHCIRDTQGAEFIFQEAMGNQARHHIVNASGLNDFVDTGLAEILKPFAGQAIHVGLIGVWTEAKITFLAYDLVTRYPEFKVAVCDALTASSSRASHFMAIDQLQSILGVRVFSSLGSFTGFLNGTSPLTKKKLNSRIDRDKLSFSKEVALADSDEQLLLYLFRDSKSVECRVLDGGFSGNVVLRAAAIDMHGHKQVPCVIKIGERDLIAKERTAFERIQEVLGNTAPSIVDFADFENRGAIKYRYASMSDEKVTSFQQFYASASDTEAICHVLKTVFVEQLGKLYEAGRLERGNILEYYWFSSRFADSVKKKVEEITGQGADGDFIELPGETRVNNIYLFYKNQVDQLLPLAQGNFCHSFVHGDLNGANILIDGHDNTWIIDFFHTHRGHILRDLVKLENDLLYIFTQVNNLDDFNQAKKLSELLFDIEDLADGLPPLANETFTGDQFTRAYKVASYLRSLYKDLLNTSRSPLQFFVAALRYSVHTLSFEECNLWQRRWALYSSAILAGKTSSLLHASDALRVDFINYTTSEIPGRMGLTILPGRRDKNRNLESDLADIKKARIGHIVCLISANEFDEYGVPGLPAAYKEQGFEVLYYPILDQQAPSKETLPPVMEFIRQRISNGQNVMLHCVGGLGRSGLVAACALKKIFGLEGSEAMRLVRQYRSERAIETRVQEEFVIDY